MDFKVAFAVLGFGAKVLEARRQVCAFGWKRSVGATLALAADCVPAFHSIPTAVLQLQKATLA